MADSAALLVDEILPHQPMRQWVLSVPFPLRFLCASQPAVIGKVLAIVYRTIATHLTHKAGFTKPMAKTGAVTLIQRFGSALNLNIHFHMLQGRKVLTLQTLPDCESDSPFASMVGEVAGFSLHAGVASKANERAKLERLCRYITRPAVSAKRLSMTRNGRVRYELNQK